MLNPLGIPRMIPTPTIAMIGVSAPSPSIAAEPTVWASAPTTRAGDGPERRMSRAANRRS